MSITGERKVELIGEFARQSDDTGSPEVQVAVLTERISNLTDHFKAVSYTHLRAHETEAEIVFRRMV